MFNLLKVLMYRKAIPLSSGVASIGETAATFRGTKPIVGLNAGAHVSIDVTRLVPVTDPLETMRNTEADFPPGCIRAAGVHPDGSSTEFRKQLVACSATGAFVQLFQEDGSNRQVKFSSIIISACRTIPNASVTWFTYGK